MSKLCLICQAVAPDCGDEGGGAYCQECAGLLRWFLSYFAHDPVVRELGWITPETTFHELGVESLDYMNWLLEAEEKLGVSILSEDAERLMTVGEFLRTLRAGGATWPPDCDLVLAREGDCLRTYAWTIVQRGKPHEKARVPSPRIPVLDTDLYDRELDG